MLNGEIDDTVRGKPLQFAPYLAPPAIAKVTASRLAEKTCDVFVKKAWKGNVMYCQLHRHPGQRRY